MKLRGTIIAVLAIAAGLAGPARAADIFDGPATADGYNGPAIAAGYDWTGPYLGIHGGHAWADRTTSLNEGFDRPVFDPGTAEIDGEGWLGGAGLGYDYQAGSIVFGAVADISKVGIEGDALIGTPTFIDKDGKDGTAWDIGYDVKAFGTLRGRVGVIAGDALLYATAGAAWARVDETHTVQDGDNPPHAASSITQDHFGWTAGGGVEWLFHRGWTFSTEYLYADLGEEDYAHDVGNQSGAPDLTAADLELHIVRAGLNYRF